MFNSGVRFGILKVVVFLMDLVKDVMEYDNFWKVVVLYRIEGVKVIVVGIGL